MQTLDLIGSAEACVLLGNIHRSTLTRWVKAGRLHSAVQLPGRNGQLLFERATVLALLALLSERSEQASA